MPPVDREDIQITFDPNGPGREGLLFGMPYTPDQADIIIMPIPWEVTVSYSAGTADGPEAVLKASAQVDLYLHGVWEPWKLPIAMLPVSPSLKRENENYRDLAASYIRWIEKEGTIENAPEMKVVPRAINEISEKLNIHTMLTAKEYLDKGKIVGLLGGDHSTPLGLLRALAKKYKSFGILQIDAHADLRIAYENFIYSHASIMYNALKLPQVSRLVQVGIRDICDQEVKYIEKSQGRIKTFFDEDIQESLFEGTHWKDITGEIINHLPEHVYISFDIDGLDPQLCPNTGTPVPGGLNFNQAVYLIKAVVDSGRKIIGFDLSEVGTGDTDWDANVGSRLLFHLCCWTAVSQKMLKAASRQF